MRARKGVEKAGSLQPMTRSLKIQPKFRFNRYSESVTPEIKLCGNWLNTLGFSLGKRVVVIMKKGELVIRVDSKEGVLSQ